MPMPEGMAMPPVAMMAESMEVPPMPQVDEGVFELTYRFEKPILFRGYILETANIEPENDPKSWTVDCRNIADNVSTVVSTIEGEKDRERWVEKEFRVNDDLGDIWTDRITIKVTATQ